jgi:hypothetical protein
MLMSMSMSTPSQQLPALNEAAVIRLAGDDGLLDSQTLCSVICAF